MSRYDFVPIQHPAGRASEDYYWWDNGFTDEQLKAIEAYGDSLALQKATIGPNEEAPSEMRRTDVAWLKHNEKTAGFYDALAGVAQNINAMSFNFDLTGFVEDLQYTVYRSEKRAHYDWHIDAGPNTYSPRKLSLSLMLTDPKEYEGGDLQIMTKAGEPTVCRKERGMVVGFPSYALHRVTPVTKGVRKSIVVWVSGPPFR